MLCRFVKFVMRNLVSVPLVNLYTGPIEGGRSEPLLPVRCKTVEFVLEDTPEYKAIVQTINDSQVRGRITIPSVSVVKIEKL